MPRSGQIIPEYLVPHVQTYINDNTEFEDFSAVSAESPIRFINVFMSAKGEDGVIKGIDNVKDYIEEYGNPNYELYGQHGYMPYAALSSGEAKCWCMRIMPQDAAYANVIINALTKIETVDGVNQVQIKFETASIDNLTDKESLAIQMDGLTVANPETNEEGWSVYPIMGFVCKGRGTYGNTLRVRFVTDDLSDKDNDYKNYTLEVLDSEGYLSIKESFTVSLYDYAVISKESIFTDDVVNDTENGSKKIESYINVANLKAIYEMYAKNVPSDSTIIPEQEFDFLFGGVKTTPNKIGNYVIDVDNGIAFDKTDGLVLTGGTQGCFALDYQPEEITYDDGTGNIVTTLGPTRDELIEQEYINAFGGVEPYDKAIRSKRRTPAEFIMDANYPENVKRALAELILYRYDARGILDAGIITTPSHALSWAADFTNISDRIISKECQHYKIRCPFSGKKIPVTVTYYLAANLPTHYKSFGNQVPFVGEAYAQLNGYVKKSLKPNIDADDLTVKEELYTNRVNFFECIAEDNFVRGVQGTSQMKWSDLSEENNVAVMLEMKRKLEEFVAARIYNFAEPADRARFTEDADRMFSDYRNKKCREFSVYFDMNAWEEERSILHCYLAIVFKTMAKRGIIEIDINKRA